MTGFNLLTQHGLQKPQRNICLLGLAAAVALSAAAFAQPQGPSKPTYNPGGVAFSPEPLRVESMGLTMLIPLGATSESANVGRLGTVRIKPAAEPGKPQGAAPWMVDIQTIGELPDEPPAVPGAARPVQPSQEPLSNAVMADRAIQTIRKNYGKVDADGNVVESQAKLLYREQNLTLKRGDAGTPWTAERFYISVPDSSGKTRLVRGTTLAQIAPGRFATFNLWVSESDFEQTRPIYEAMVASANLSDPAETNLARAALIGAGRQLLAGLSPDDYRAVIEARGERWDRLYKLPPSRDDAMAFERGYRRTKVWIGQKGEMNPDRDRAKWKAAEETPGYLVSYEYRLLNDPEHPPANGQWSMNDASALYFMSLDGTEEMWVIRQTERGPNARAGTTKETGARQNNQMLITTEGPGVAPVAIKPIFNDDGYLSQVQTFLLPQLLVHAAAPADYGFYCYNSGTQKIQLRKDSLRQPSDRPGIWELRFKLTEDSADLLMVLNSDGQLVRSELPGGWIWEPTTSDRLVSLWRAKGLPME